MPNPPPRPPPPATPTGPPSLAELRQSNPWQLCLADPVPKPVGGGTFHIDIERAPQAIRELKSALDQLQQLRLDAAALAQSTNAGSNGSVSIDMARLLAATADGGPGSLADAVDKGITQVKQLIAAMETEVATYSQTEANSARRVHNVDAS